MNAFTVVAEAGLVRVRHIDATVAGCLAWAALMRTHGWLVSEPEPCEGYGESSLDDRRERWPDAA